MLWENVCDKASCENAGDIPVYTCTGMNMMNSTHVEHTCISQDQSVHLVQAQSVHIQAQSVHLAQAQTVLIQAQSVLHIQA